MRPAAARPLRMGVGDSEPADIGRARPQLDDHVRAGGAPSQRERRTKKRTRETRTEKKGLEHSRDSVFLRPATPRSRVPIVHALLIFSVFVSSVLTALFLNYYHLYSSKNIIKIFNIIQRKEREESEKG